MAQYTDLVNGPCCPRCGSYDFTGKVGFDGFSHFTTYTNYDRVMVPTSPPKLTVTCHRCGWREEGYAPYREEVQEEIKELRSDNSIPTVEVLDKDWYWECNTYFEDDDGET